MKIHSDKRFSDDVFDFVAPTTILGIFFSVLLGAVLTWWVAGIVIPTLFIFMGYTFAKDKTYYKKYFSGHYQREAYLMWAKTPEAYRAGIEFDYKALREMNDDEAWNYRDIIEQAIQYNRKVIGDLGPTRAQKAIQDARYRMEAIKSISGDF